MERPCRVPSKSSMFALKLGCGYELLRTCMTGCLEVELRLNCRNTLSGSAAEVTRLGRYPNSCGLVFPVLLPWHRKQFSYWFTAGETTLCPSIALIPLIPFCDGRISGGVGKLRPTCLLPCGLWQSTQVACRL